MGTVTTKFSGDVKDAEAAYRKIERENVRLRDSLSRVKRESREGGDVFQHIFRENLNYLTKTALALVSVEKGIDLVVEAYGEWRRELKELEQANRQLDQSVMKTLGRTGDLAAARRFEETLKGLGPDEKRERLAAFEAVGEADPMMHFERRRDIAQQVSRLAVAHDPAELGRLAGALGKLAPDMAPKQVGGMAVSALDRAGGRAGELTNPALLRSIADLKEAGLTMEQALAVVITGLRKNLSTKTIEMLATEIEEPRETKTHRGRRLTEEERANNALSGQAAWEKLRLLLEDEEARGILKPRERAAMKGLTRDQVVAEAQAITMRAPSAIAAEESAIGRSEGGRRELRRREDARRLAAAQTEEVRQAFKEERIDQALEARLRERSSNPLVRGLLRSGTWIRRFNYWAGESLLGNTPTAEGFLRSEGYDEGRLNRIFDGDVAPERESALSRTVKGLFRAIDTGPQRVIRKRILAIPAFWDRPERPDSRVSLPRRVLRHVGFEHFLPWEPGPSDGAATESPSNGRAAASTLPARSAGRGEQLLAEIAAGQRVQADAARETNRILLAGQRRPQANLNRE